MAGHSRLSPSKADRWSACPASVKRTAHITDQQNIYTLEGTIAHALGAHVLQHGTNIATYEGKKVKDFMPRSEYVELSSALFNQGDKRLQQMLTEFVVDEDMTRYVGEYVQLVRTTMEEHPGAELFVEQRYSLEDLLGPGEGGTADATILTDTLIIVFDLKYGKGKRVSADGNKQMQLYGLGALINFADVMGYPVETVEMVICQPRLDSVDRWASSAKELRIRQPWSMRAERTREPSPEVAPGEHCHWCGYRAECPELAAVIGATVTGQTFLTTEDFMSLPETAQPTAEIAGNHIAILLPHLDFIQSWCTAVYERAYELLAEGTAIPGYKMVAGKRGARAWSSENEAEMALRTLSVPDDVMFKRSLISPTEAEKRLGKKLYENLQRWVTQSCGKPAVVPESDKRPAISMGANEDDFMTNDTENQ